MISISKSCTRQLRVRGLVIRNKFTDLLHKNTRGNEQYDAWTSMRNVMFITNRTEGKRKLKDRGRRYDFDAHISIQETSGKAEKSQLMQLATYYPRCVNARLLYKNISTLKNRVNFFSI